MTEDRKEKIGKIAFTYAANEIMTGDFTVKTYRKLLNALKSQGFSFQSVVGFSQNPKSRTIILRHDVDALLLNSLRFARIQSSIGIEGTYYFRAVPQSFDEAIIKEIASLGHEIGYHYENLSAVSSRKDFREVKGKRRKDKVDIYSKAICDFERNLEKLREFYPVKTICMHGSPLSKWDNRDLWKRYDYRNYGIIGEPYFDIDFDEVLYLTDTGRRWDGGGVSVRDKIRSQRTEGRGQGTEQGDGWMNRMIPAGLDGNGLAQRRRGAKKRLKNDGIKEFEGKKCWPRYHSTFDIIEAVEAGKFPEKAMLTVHPQRWTDDRFQWAKELVWQNVKNIVKRVLIHRLR